MKLTLTCPHASYDATMRIVCAKDGGKLCGKVTISYAESAAEPQKAAEQEYGIRFDTASGVSVGERLGAARGLRFNCPIAGSWLHNGRNDFDNAYPWSGIRRCSIAVDSNGSSTICSRFVPTVDTFSALR